MIKKIISCLLLISSPLYAATYYMANNPCSGNSGWGNGSNANAGTKAAPWLTIAYATDNMSGGDTLIIDDGTYTGTTNALNTYNSNVPPNGTAEAYTIIKAENDGKVIFDGAGTNNMFYLVGVDDAKYWQFEGFIVGRPASGISAIYIQDLTHVKFLRVGGYEAGLGNTAVFATYDNSYILYEGCYAWGNGRYRFLAYISDHIVYRNCIGRPDRIDTTGSVNPSAGFSIYSSDYVEVQNCIIIDGDTDAYWVTNGRQGCFFVPTTAAGSSYVAFRNSIGINTALGGFQTASNNPATNISVTNMLLWNVDSEDEAAIPGLLLNLRGDNTITNMTFGASHNSAAANSSEWYNWGSVVNSIFYNLTWDADDLFFEAWAGEPDASDDYNSLYANTEITQWVGTHNITATNPITSIPYLVKVESGSAMDSAGSGGADIGANILYLVGTTGTLYGETGYATETAIKMWPFPNEALIRTAMRAYTWDDGSGGDPEITGARGFAANDHTITEYVLNYLSPADPITVEGSSPNKTTVTAKVDEVIYGESGETDTVDPVCAFDDNSNPQTINGYSYTWTGTCSDAKGINAVKIRLTSAPDGSNGTLCTGTTSWSCTISGLVMGNNDVHVAGSDGTNWGDVNKTVNAPPYRASAGGSYNIR